MGGNILPFQSHFFTVLLYRKIPVFSDGFKKFYSDLSIMNKIIPARMIAYIIHGIVIIWTV